MTKGYDNETGLSTAGLNGKGKYVAEVANHAALVLLSRLMAVFGVPMAGFIFWLMWTDIDTIAEVAAHNQKALAVQGTRLTIVENEVNRLRDQ